MNKDQVYDRCKQIVIDRLGVAPDKVVPTANFEGDLGADSLKLVELAMIVQKDFNIMISEDEAVSWLTFEDAVDGIYAKIS
jgi:acyl carrier protein